jgi:hypothetical protein
MDFRKTRFASVSLLVVIGLVAFAIARSLLFSSDGLGAQDSLGDGPTAGPEAKSAIEAIELDKAKPDFAGSLNGFQFFDPSRTAAQIPQPCDGLTNGVEREASQEEVAASSLDFEVGYLPGGAQLSFEGGNKCRGIVVAAVKNFSTDEMKIAVMRVANTPQIVADAPQDRLEAATIGGRPAVIEHSVVPEGRTAVYLRDELGYWIISGVRVPETEVLKIAASLS